MKKTLISLLIVHTLLLNAPSAAEKPNILIVLVDDMG